MKSNSIKRTLPLLTKVMVLFFLLLLLPVNVWLQLHLQHRSQQESAREMFGQLEQLIEANENDIEERKKAFADQCLQSARVASYYVEHAPEMIKSLTHTRELAENLNVDEIHYFTPKGIIFAGTNPDYYGLSFDSGEQMEYFRPMLEDKTMDMCQGILPNTAEGKEMQYAAAWLSDGRCIVQVGMHPQRLMEEIEEKSLRNIIASLPFRLNGGLHIISRKDYTVQASNYPQLIGISMEKFSPDYKRKDPAKVFHQEFQGKRYCVYTKKVDDYILVRTYPATYPVQTTFQSTLMVLVYVVLVAFGVVSIIRWYIDKRLIRNLTRIINDLKRVEDGNMEEIALKTGVTEFDELLFYINQMIGSIKSNWDRLSYIMDKGRIPIGIMEVDIFYKKTFLNERMMDILGIHDYEGMSMKERAELVHSKLSEAEKKVVDEKENIYEYDRNGSISHIRIEKDVKVQKVTYYVTDMSLWWGEIYQLREQNELDALTGLYNRRGFNERIGQLFQNKEELGCAAILIVDADNLKKINDIYGHLMGDEYLKTIAQTIQEAAGVPSICARLGGDEFAVFLYGETNISHLERRIDFVKKQRGKPFLEENEEVYETLQFSIGIAFYPMDGQDYHMLMRIADENMYQEKKGRKAEIS